MEVDATPRLKIITFPYNIEDIKQKQNWLEIAEVLKRDFKINPSESLYIEFSAEVVDKLTCLLEILRCNSSWNNDVKELLAEIFKAFRLYVLNKDTANYLKDNNQFFDILTEYVGVLFNPGNTTEDLFPKYVLQFLLHFCSAGGEPAVEKIRRFYLETFCRYLSKDSCYLYETSALIYNLCKGITIENYELIKEIILKHSDQFKPNEFLNFLMEQVINEDYVWKNYYTFEVEVRRILINCLKEILIYAGSSSLVIKVETVPKSCIECFVSVFNSSTNIIFQVSSPDCHEKASEVYEIIEILAHLSSDEKYLTHFKDNKDVFINAGVLLINVHRLGKASENEFTPLQKLSEITKPSEVTTRNPVFGFKADLVRLIGNMCWKNWKMQELARQADVISVLLDCCNIDAKNPFIIQWVILAVRNLCENNLENQNYIGSLNKEGIVSTALLEELGVNLHSEKDLSLRMVPLDLSK